MPKEKKEKEKTKSKKIVIVEEITPEVETEKVIETEKKEEETVIDSQKSETPEVKEEVEPIDPVGVEEKKEETEKVEKVEVDKPNYLWIIIPTALLVGALVGGLITYFSGVSKLNKEEVTPSPISSEVPTGEATPIASPTGKLKRDTLKVQVLNGSGVSGAAGKAQTYLEGLGYKDVATGNAATSDFTETEISIKDASKDYLDLLKTDLAKNYKVATSTSTLVTTSRYDVVVTLGTK